VSSPELFRKELPDRVRRTEECANAPPEDAERRVCVYIDMEGGSSNNSSIVDTKPETASAKAWADV